MTGTAPIFAVWPLNSWHAAQRMRRDSARYARRFVRRAVMNAPNIKRSIVSNALKSVTSALRNAGTWQRNNTDPPLSTIRRQWNNPQRWRSRTRSLNTLDACERVLRCASKTRHFYVEPLRVPGVFILCPNWSKSTLLHPNTTK